MKKTYNIKVIGDGKAELTYTFNGRKSMFNYEGMGMGNVSFQCEKLGKYELKELKKLEGNKLSLEDFNKVTDTFYKKIKN
jgi:hypothetical protein